MKKNILKLSFALAVVVAAGYTVYSSQTSLKMTGIALNNVEALASGEASAGDPCYRGSYNSALPEAIKCAQPCRKERCGGTIDKCY